MAVALSENEHEITAGGEFRRQANHFRGEFSADGSTGWPVEPGRYALIVAPTCPWASRAVIVRRLLGLEDVLPLVVAGTRHPDHGWELPAAARDQLGARWLPEIYARTDPSYSGRATVPSIVDLRGGQVVSNDYHRLTIELETAWAAHHRQGAPDLYPPDLRAGVDALNEVVFRELNNGVYRAGFARSQAAYERAYDDVFNRLDDLERRLAGSRYLFGARLTDADIRLFVTLVRFDVAYYGAFKCNRNQLVDFPALWAYARDLYQTPGIGETVDFPAIKRGYWSINNPTGIIPKGPDLSGWTTPQGREALAS